MNEENKIRQQFQSKFSDFRAPVLEDGWQRLEQSLAAASAAKVIRRRWYYGSAAAVLVMLIGSLLFMQNPQQETVPTITEAVAPSTEQKQDKVAQQRVVEPQEPLIAQQQTTEKRNVFGKTAKTNVAPASTEKEEVKNPLLGFIRKQTEKTISDKKEFDENVEQFDEAEKQRLIEDFIRAGEGEELLLADAFSTEDKQNMMLSLSGRGGLTSFQKTVNSPMTLRSAAVAGESSDNLLNRSPMALAMSNTANNIAEMEHSQPVSFGLMVSKSLFDNLSIETGLVYTYLYSKARNTNIASKIQETQQFHYIGVPLNVNYNVISFRDLDVYVSLGGMVERDFAGKRQYMAQTSTELNSTEERITEKIKQNNHQYSVNAGVGVSYPILDKINLYGKVGGSYYFDAENPYNTIYSDKKIMLDLNVGLRYEF